MLVTHIAAATAGLSWMLTEWAHKGKPTVLGIVSGAISGLVVITPGAGYVDQTGAFVMGLVGGVACYFGIMLKNLLGFDGGTDGAFYGNGEQLGWQLAGILMTSVYSAVGTAVIMLGLKFTIGIRVSEEDEDMGFSLFD